MHTIHPELYVILVILNTIQGRVDGMHIGTQGMTIEILRLFTCNWKSHCVTEVKPVDAHALYKRVMTVHIG